MKNIFLAASLLFCGYSFGQPLWMRYPSISPDGNNIAFSYKGDLFVVNAKGGNAHQITSHKAHDFMPVWSPDSKSIAFSSDRHGNFDVFITSVDGGAPKRLTHHSSSDYVYSFTADGKNLLYGSTRTDDVNSVQFPTWVLSELYSVPVEGGRETQYLTITAEDVSFNKSGTKMLFHNRKGYEDPWRKHHTSSVTRDIVMYDVENKSYKMITDWSGEDRNPVWIDDNNFYFLSEKSGSFNIWKGTLDNPYGQQITNYKNNPVRFLSIASNGTLCYGFDGEIYTYANGTSTKLNIDIKKDDVHNESKIQHVASAGQFDVSSNGKEIAFIYRGEVFVTSIEYGTTKRITDTPEMERNVSFSPGGEALLYCGERNESWNIYQTKHKREGEKYFYNATLLEEEVLVNNGEETFQPKYSPDGKEVAFLENRVTLRVINLESKKIRTVLPAEYNYSYADGDQYYTWSPDSKWLAVEFFEFSRWSTDVGLVNASGKEKPINLTKSGYGSGGPKFAMDGEMVYYANGKHGLRAHGGWGNENDVEAVFLTEEAYQKFKLDKEEFELWQEEQKDKKKKEAKEDEDKKKDDKEDKEETAKELKIELEGLEDRKVRLTIHSSQMSDFLVDNEGTQLFYFARFEKGFNIWTTKFKENETKMLAKLNSSGGGMQFSKDEKTIYFNKSGALMKIDAKGGTPEPIAISSEMTLRPSEERSYMFYHAWRQLREKFYVEDLHGVDWDLYRKTYEKFLPHINNGYDFAEMLSELLGEVNASHTGARYRHRDTNGDQTASLCAFYDESFKGDGLKIVEIMKKGPLSKGSDKVKAGVIIEKIDGETIESNQNFYPMLNRKAGKKLLLSFYDPSTKERWDEIIEAASIGLEFELLYQRWVKICETTVDELSNGELGYVHIRGMSSGSYRDLFDKALGEYHEKKALIVDTRFNGGGWLHDDLATFLSGKLYMSFEPRGQKNMGGEPIFKWQKPSCVLMSEGNYSDAHLFPYTYKALGIGKLIGMPVPGTGTAVWWETMIDGKTVFGIPQVGMRSQSEGFLVENHDLEPDIKVNNEYGAFTKGDDQQLKAAITEMMK
ncbi:S41 family peptidase [Paracrocinitomix mangrovi]|uniref:S41 family peptidase n=1 Tax=Paracrocinitomix mangrovi TaxID=2862509 RepID=UPI001C8D9906|nr:S41 family peptidase [Paracrocinitomix mangrovi]UKN02467.1 S41 family peptidase [Paracrocinitomix mangrovi]